MIPVRLKIRNFMPYRGDMPSFSFEGIQTACISGDNGHGKSAIIDALTWALWGESRAKNIDDVIHIKESEATIEFDFMAEGQLYRVIRKRARPKKATAAGQSSLDLMIFDNGEFKIISADKINETQAKITNEILRMDYDTFINSAFLRQGNADQFTRQQPAKRKEVLSNILGLDIYDKLESKAREMARKQHVDIKTTEKLIQDIDSELADQNELKSNLERAETELLQAEKAVKEKQTELDNVKQKRQALESKKPQLHQLEEHISSINKQLDLRIKEKEQHEKQISGYESLIVERNKIEKGYENFKQVKALCDEFNIKLQELNSLKDSQRRFERSVESALSELNAKKAELQKIIERLTDKAQKLEQYKSEMAKIEEAIPRLEKKEKDFEDNKQKRQALQSAVAQLKDNQEKLKLEIDGINDKLNLLCKEGENVCPLCETALGKEGLDIIRAKFGSDLEAKNELIKQKGSEITALLAEAQNIEKELSEKERELKSNREWLQNRVGSLKQSIDDATEAANELVEQKEMLADIEHKLETKDYSVSEQQELKAINANIASLDYDSEKHKSSQKELAELGEFETKKRQLEEATRYLATEKEDLAKTIVALNDLQKQLEIDNNKKDLIEKELEALSQLESESEQAEEIFRKVSAAQKEAQETTVRLKARLQHLQDQEKKKKEKEKQLKLLTNEISIYDQLALAFGKKGIQMMLIESSLPDVENEANDLLGRMTDNRMHVRFESQKPTKKGDVQETLEIIISDELGSRPYETYSGGEAFRIDLAIRIALSKLLAKRAGAPLPTLIIDEGFGSLDSTGIDKIKEAINSIKNDFEKIIVITHIEELKDAFPSRINVRKTPDGSVIELN
ncbi:MAG: SMC family ATPase [Dehalococcoidales bacterium]